MLLEFTQYVTAVGAINYRNPRIQNVVVDIQYITTGHRVSKAYRILLQLNVTVACVGIYSFKTKACTIMKPTGLSVQME